MKKPLLSLILLLCVLCVAWTALPVLAAENEEAETVTVYFTSGKNIRPRMVSNGDSLGTYPSYTPITLTLLDRKWGSFTLENGKTGYIWLDGMIPMPAFEPVPEVTRYSPEALPLWGVPLASAPAIDQLEGWELCVEDGRSDGFIHIRIPGRDLSGYVKEGVLQEPVFPLLEEATLYTVVCDRAVDLTNMPLKGAEVTGQLPANTMITAYDAGYSAYLMIQKADEVSWVSRADLCACMEDEESGTPLFVPLDEKSEIGPEIVFRYATVSGSGTKLIGANGLTTQLEAGERVLICFTYGQTAALTTPDSAGFADLDALVTESAAEKAAYIQSLDLSGAGIQKSEWLDAAFTMLEEDNSLLLRYNAATGSDIQALLPLGVPYFWGGRSIYMIRSRLPEYNTTAAWQSSPVYYRAGKVYLTGFDCVGFVKAVCTLAKHPVAEALKDLVNRGYHSQGLHVWCKADRPIPDDWKKVAEELEIGDILVLFHPGEHVLLYAGTLRQYGYTEETLPAAADYLDYPLMIQCGEDPFYYLHMSEYIRTSGDSRVARANPPDGGVNFCLLGVPFEAAEYVFNCHGSVYPCFLAEGTCINIYNFNTVTNYAFARVTTRTATQTPAATETPAPTQTPTP